jgi:type II secretory pathway pseudopilin PulG
MNRVDNRQQGFTVIELTLAMTFVTVLMVTIALTITQLANIYNKGTTLRAVDQAGRAISRDLQSTLAESQPLDVSSDVLGGANFRQQAEVGGDASSPDGGRLCSGSFSYIWNTGKGLQNPVNSYEKSDEKIRLVKVRDTGALYCGDTSLKIKKEDAIELLSSGDRELAIQSLQIRTAASDPVTQQALYRITLEIGTNDKDSLNQSTSINSIDTTCKPPNDDASVQDFCAVNQFEFTVRAGNRGNN